MKPRFADATLGVLALVWMPIYLFVLFVATVTSGSELLRQPGAWYAALVPLSYVGLAGAYALGLATRPLARPTMVALHVGVAPAVLFSFLGMGLLLPVFAVLFWRFMSRQQAVAAP